MKGSYAHEGGEEPKISFMIGEGLVGQGALDKKPIVLKSAPEDYMKVESAWGSSKPVSVMIYPILFENEVLGVVELAPLTRQHHCKSAFVSAESIAWHHSEQYYRSSASRAARESQAMTEELQVQSEEPQTQQEELRRTNENLEEQTNALKRSEDLPRRQQEELEHYNTELVAKTRALEEQVQEVEEKNDEIEKARMRLERQAKRLSITTKYKSEFMANMSHESRTRLTVC